MIATKIERVRCSQDRRPRGAGISFEARMFVFAMEAAGVRFELSEDGRGVRARPGQRISDQQRLVLRAMFHEIRQLLEEERPQ